LAFTTNGTSAWYFADANGNISNLFTPADTAAASYTYDAFGRRFSSTGTLANVNTFQWSSKENHEPSGLVYYLYRYYNPQTGRWASRDPIGARGGINLYCYVQNSPIDNYDLFGLKCITSLSVIYSQANDGSQRVLPSPDNGPPTGRVYRGSLNATYDDGTQGSWAVLSGGYRSSPAIIPGDDSSTPAGNFTVRTKQGGTLNGFYIDGTGARNAIMIHNAPGHIGTHGCVGIDGGFSDFAEDMKTTKDCCKKKSVPISISYNVSDDDAPHGDKGQGKSSPYGPPIEPDPGPTNSGIPY
jgi:RHS repeat-associated protein